MPNEAIRLNAKSNANYINKIKTEEIPVDRIKKLINDISVQDFK
jgi:ribosomal protein L20